MKQVLTLLLLSTALFLSGCATDPEVEAAKERQIEASGYNADLGLAYMRQGRNSLAIEKLKKALEQDPKNPRAHHYIAQLYSMLDEKHKAETHFRKALALTPDDSMLKNNYGVFLCGEGKYDEASGYFIQVLEDPLYVNKGPVYENLGLCAMDKGDITVAEFNLKKALKWMPDSPKSLLAMGQLSFDTGNYSNARLYLYKYLQNARHNAASLWLGILLERRSGNKNRVASYETLLKGKFPDSKEAMLLKKLQATGAM